ncbi:hypothetical protein [Microbispora sp. H10949]|uniref:hypothetical protein n=1 Tax=Microbispora sp. H10949 TaxID=2729111 RepID=UPI0016031358|nr:hypothetical protein [Microbispora sp. H10949]
MLTRRRKQMDDRCLARLPDTIARLVEFDVIGTDTGGKTKTKLCNLYDHRPRAGAIVAKTGS